MQAHSLFSKVLAGVHRPTNRLDRWDRTHLSEIWWTLVQIQNYYARCKQSLTCVPLAYLKCGFSSHTVPSFADQMPSAMASATPSPPHEAVRMNISIYGKVKYTTISASAPSTSPFVLLLTQQSTFAEVCVRIGASVEIAEANGLALCVVATTRADRPWTHGIIRTAHIVCTTQMLETTSGRFYAEGFDPVNSASASAV